MVFVPCLSQAADARPLPADAPASESFLTPDAAVAAAVRLHPSVVSAQVAHQQALGEAAQLRVLLSNPSVSGSLSVDGQRSSGSVSQPLSLTGEGFAARREASARVEAARLRLWRAQLEAALACRAAYANSIVRSGKVAIAEEGLELTQKLRVAVARQLEVGEASTLELRLAQLAEVQAGARLLEAHKQQAEAVRELSALTGVSVDSFALASDPRVVLPQASIHSPTGPERSDLLAARASIQAATANRTRTRAAVLAPVGLGVFVSEEGPERFVGPSVQATLPIFDRNQADRGAAEAALDQARAAEHALAAKIESERHSAKHRVFVADGLESATLENPIAEARTALASIDAGYRSGEVDLPSTILLQKEVLTGESAALDLLGGITLARLDWLLAVEDPALLQPQEVAAGQVGGVP